MNRTLLFILFAVLLTSACSEKKLPEQAAVKSRDTLSALRDIDAAYEKKNLDRFMAGIAPVYPDRDGLSEAVGSVFREFESITLNIHYPKMLIMIDQSGGTRAEFNWDGTWIRTGGDVQKNVGRAAFVFSPEEFKLVSIEGRNPFIPGTKENLDR